MAQLLLWCAGEEDASHAEAMAHRAAADCTHELCIQRPQSADNGSIRINNLEFFFDAARAVAGDVESPAEAFDLEFERLLIRTQPAETQQRPTAAAAADLGNDSGGATR